MFVSLTAARCMHLTNPTNEEVLQFHFNRQLHLNAAYTKISKVHTTMIPEHRERERAQNILPNEYHSHLRSRLKNLNLFFFGIAYFASIIFIIFN